MGLIPRSAVQRAQLLRQPERPILAWPTGVVLVGQILDPIIRKPHAPIAGIAKLLAADCNLLAKVG